MAKLSTESDVRDWLLGTLSETLDMPKTEIKGDVPLSVYGVNSLMAAMLADEMQEQFGLDLDPEFLADYQTLDEVAGYIAQMSKSH